jgi:hypothetical protein
VSIERVKEWGDTRDRDLRELKKVGLGLGHGGVRSLAVKGGERVQKDRDKERHWDCASGPMEVGRCLWREVASEGGLSAWQEVIDFVPARCSTISRLSERGR